jgi:hypothetical protein
MRLLLYNQLTLRRAADPTQEEKQSTKVVDSKSGWLTFLQKLISFRTSIIDTSCGVVTTIAPSTPVALRYCAIEMCSSEVPGGAAHNESEVRQSSIARYPDSSTWVIQAKLSFTERHLHRP